MRPTTKDALAAVAIVVASVCIIAIASQPPSPSSFDGGQEEQQHRTDKDCHRHAKGGLGSFGGQYGGDYRADNKGGPTSDWWTKGAALGTVAIAFLTVAQLFIYYRQATLMQRGLGTANANAEAAKRNALAAEAMIERPWLVLVVPEIGGDEDDPSTHVPGIYWEGDGTHTRNRAADVTFPFEVKNFGKAPAWILEAGIELRLTDYPVPEGLTFPAPSNEILRDRGTLPPAPFWGNRDECALQVPPDEQKQMSDGSRVLVFIGRISYRGAETNRKPHVTTFCWVFDRKSLTLRDHHGEPRKTEWAETPWFKTPGPASYFQAT